MKQTTTTSAETADDNKETTFRQAGKTVCIINLLTRENVAIHCCIMDQAGKTHAYNF